MYNIVTCRGDLWEGFGLDDSIYCILHIHNSGQQVIQRYRYSTHGSTRIGILGLH
jgi:hypothetical protein